ncbi:MAG: hypothetical protein ABJL72_15935 [Roseobacter sp.]
MKRILQLKAMIVAIGLISCQALPVSAQQMCAPVEAVLDFLADNYDEEIVLVGNFEDGSQMLVLINPDGSTFSVLSVASGLACITAEGRGWTAIKSVSPAQRLEL